MKAPRLPTSELQTKIDLFVIIWHCRGCCKNSPLESTIEETALLDGDIVVSAAESSSIFCDFHARTSV